MNLQELIEHLTHEEFCLFLSTGDESLFTKYIPLKITKYVKIRKGLPTTKPTQV